ncbi:MAG TPA: hypothetical protein PK036_13590 [Geobacteraceae bacterium]|nr:hypothetical protein [Geobacteraceae bacterium]
MTREMDEIVNRLISDGGFRRRVVRFLAESIGEENMMRITITKKLNAPA